jgi:hypothetical protein
MILIEFTQTRHEFEQVANFFAFRFSTFALSCQRSCRTLLLPRELSARSVSTWMLFPDGLDPMVVRIAQTTSLEECLQVRYNPPAPHVHLA